MSAHAIALPLASSGLPEADGNKRWGTAFAGVLAFHLVALIIAAQWQGKLVPPQKPEMAIALDLAPMPATGEPTAAPAQAAAAPAQAQPKPPPTDHSGLFPDATRLPGGSCGPDVDDLGRFSRTGCRRHKKDNADPDDETTHRAGLSGTVTNITNPKRERGRMADRHRWAGQGLTQPLQRRSLPRSRHESDVRSRPGRTVHMRNR